MYAVCIIFLLYYRDKIGSGEIEIGYRNNRDEQEAIGSWAVSKIGRVLLILIFMARINSVELPEHFLW